MHTCNRQFTYLASRSYINHTSTQWRKAPCQNFYRISSSFFSISDSPDPSPTCHPRKPRSPIQLHGRLSRQGGDSRTSGRVRQEIRRWANGPTLTLNTCSELYLHPRDKRTNGLFTASKASSLGPFTANLASFSETLRGCNIPGALAVASLLRSRETDE